MRPPCGVKDMLYAYKIPMQENYLLKPRDSELDKLKYQRTRLKNQYTSDRIYRNGNRVISKELLDVLMK